jgi:histidinol-phosphate aminotransferase
MTRGRTAARAADPAEGLALLKPAVKAQPAYTLDAPAFRRKLNQNEAPRDLPEPLKRAILDRAMAMPWHRYPEFVPHALAARVAARYGVAEEAVLVGNGSNELIQAALTVLLEPGDVVVAPAPTFSLYRLITNVIGGRYIPVALGEDFAYDEDSLVETAIAEEAKAVVVCAPNNPTGSGISDGLVRRLLERTEAMILVDEAYQEFGGPTALPLVRESSRVMVLRTFSKALGLAGLRCGVGLVHPEVAKEVAKAKLPYNVNHVTLAAAEIVLDHPQLIDEVVRETIAVRDRFTAALAQVPGFRPIPSQANFVLVRCTKQAPKVVFQRLLDEHGILVRNVSGVPELRDCLRISVGMAEDMDDALQALRAVAGA